MEYDNKHHEVAIRLLEGLGLESVDVSFEEDVASVADRFVGKRRLPMGMKRRGANSRNDYNLSAWSQKNGDLLEFATAGGKLYLYWMKYGHVLIEYREQELLDTLLPEEWKPITDGRNFKWAGRHAGVRLTSMASNTQQGVVFVPEEMTIIRAIWDSNEKLQWSDNPWVMKVA